MGYTFWGNEMGRVGLIRYDLVGLGVARRIGVWDVVEDMHRDRRGRRIVFATINHSFICESGLCLNPWCCGGDMLLFIAYARRTKGMDKGYGLRSDEGVVSCCS